MTGIVQACESCTPRVVVMMTMMHHVTVAVVMDMTLHLRHLSMDVVGVVVGMGMTAFVMITHARE